MRDIPTTRINSAAQNDLKFMHGINVNEELAAYYKQACELDAILVSEEEYNDLTTDIVSANDFVVRQQRIASKIIGIERPDGTVDVEDFMGNKLESFKNKDEFSKKYFLDFL